MSDHKIINVDFENKQITSIEEVEEPKEEKLDPILQEVKEGLDPEFFEIYKNVIDDWMRRNFEKQFREEDWKLNER